MSGDEDTQKIRSCLDKCRIFIAFCLNLVWFGVTLGLPCPASPLLVISSCCGSVLGCVTLALQLALPSRIVFHTYYRVVVTLIVLPIFIFGCCIAFPLYPEIGTIDCHPVVFYFAFVHYCFILTSIAFVLTIYTSIGFCVWGVDDE